MSRQTKAETRDHRKVFSKQGVFMHSTGIIPYESRQLLSTHRDPSLEEIYVDPQIGISISPNAKNDDSNKLLLEKMRECLRILRQSRYNVPSFKNYADATYKINSVIALQEWAYCLIGIPLVIIGGAIGNHIYVAHDVQDKISEPLAAVAAVIKNKTICEEKIHDLSYRIRHSTINKDCIKIGESLNLDCVARKKKERFDMQQEVGNLEKEKTRLNGIIYGYESTISDERRDGFFQILPLYLLFMASLAVSYCYYLHLIRQRQTNLEEYRKNPVNLGQCLTDNDLLKVVDTIETLTIEFKENLAKVISPKEIFLEDLITRLSYRILKEEHKESWFWLRISLIEDNFPKELIDSITAISINLGLTLQSRRDCLQTSIG